MILNGNALLGESFCTATGAAAAEVAAPKGVAAAEVGEAAAPPARFEDAGEDGRLLLGDAPFGEVCPSPEALREGERLCRILHIEKSAKRT